MMYFSHLLEKARIWLPLLPLLLLLVATWWLNQQVSPLEQVISKPRHEVDYEMENFSAISLNVQGQPIHSISAEKLWHYPDDDTTHLQMPVLKSMFAENPSIVTSALSGKITSKGDEVFLYGEVRMVRLPGDGMGEQRFATEYLHVVPDRDWADSDRAVALTTQYSTIRAVGMELDNKARTVRLLSRVKAQHEPVRR